MAKKTERKAKTAAVVSVVDASKMTRRGKKEIARWLRRVGAHLERDGDNYAKRFTSRYLYGG